MTTTGHRVAFVCDGSPVEVEHAPGESLLSVLRERLRLVGVKDGCAPQGQCGCCTVLVDGEPRVACVTPVERVTDRSVTTVGGLDPARRDALATAFLATGGSQCGFCTPGIVVRAAALLERGRTRRVDVERALAAHLCRCTGWQTIFEAIDAATGGASAPGAVRSPAGGAERASLEGGVAQRVAADVPLGYGGFADDTAPSDSLVAVPLPPGVDRDTARAHRAAGHDWVVGETLAEARARAAKLQGRRTTVEELAPLERPAVDAPAHAVVLATGWVEPAYLEPDASWCSPGGTPASPLANGGAFGGKADSLAPAAARALADELGRTVRVVYSREDSVRLGAKRPPVAAVAWLDPAERPVVRIRGRVARGAWSPDATWPSPYDVEIDARWDPATLAGPPVGSARAVGLAEQCALIEGALTAAGADRPALVRDDRVRAVLLDTVVVADGGAAAGARVHVDPANGAITRVEVRVAAGDPLDEVVLRSYCIGATHMALGWVASEGLAVDPETGDVLDLTIRSFDVVRPARMPPVEVTILEDAGPARPTASDAVFAAVAAAAWDAITGAEGARPESWPARATRAARALRR